MIARTHSGKDFAEVARYLAGRGEGSDPVRVAWTSSQNLVDDDPHLSADLMQATAAQNLLVVEPAYQLTLSFAPEDNPTRELMERIANDVLARLGLADHQALLVAHHDRSHQHVHVLINRIHPETLAPWDRWHDQVALDRILADLEVAHGLRRVTERDERLTERAVPIEQAVEMGRAEAQSDRPLVLTVRQHLSEIRAAKSWDDLRDRLSVHGIALERRAHGLSFANDETRVKASLVAADTSLARLETRLGQYSDRQPQEPKPATQREQSPYETAREIDAAQQRLRQAEWAVGRAERSGHDALRTLSDTYTDPSTASRELLRYADQHGADRVTDALRQHPEQFGTIVAAERRFVFGLWTSRTEEPARQAAAESTIVVREWIGHTNHARQLLDLEPNATNDAVHRALVDLRLSTNETLTRLRVYGPASALKHVAPMKEFSQAITDSILGREADRGR